MSHRYTSGGGGGGSVTETGIILSDVTTDNVTSTKHGFAPKSPADATKFLNGDTTPAYAQVKDSDLSTTDVTTNNVSTSKHGFAPKLSGNATDFLNGVGAYSAPAGGVTTTGTPANGNLAKFSGASSITNGDLSGDVTTTGTLATTIANDAVTTAKINNAAVTLAKIANASASSKLVGSGDSGSGASYSELSLGTGLTMSGTTLNASGGGGGGGGGTVAGVLPLDVVPGSPHASDDEFAGGSLDAKWTNPSVTANGLTLAVANDWVAFEPSTSGTGTVSGRLFGIRQAAPSGSFKIMAKVIATPGQAAGTDSYDGVFVGVSGGKGHVWGIGRNTNASLATIAATTYGEGASDWSTFDGFNNTANLLLGYTIGWYRIRWDSSATTLYFDYSLNGVAWQVGYSRTGQSQPTSIGLGMYATNNTFRADKSMGADWFRVEANANF